MTKTMTKYGIAALVAVLAMSTVAIAFSQSAVAAPANKTMIGSSDLVAVPNTGGWTTIVSGEIKTSTPSDLIVSHNQECAIHTGLNLDEGTEEATSAIREDIRLVVDGNVVAATYADPHTTPTNELEDQFGLITMCGRAYSIDTNVLSTLFDLCQAVGVIEGVTYVCPDEIFFDSYIKTKQAHSWDWVVLNVGSGVHVVEVQAKITNSLEAIGDGNGKKGKSTDSGTCPTNDDNCVDTVLELGKRNLIVVEDKLATFQTLG